MGERKSTGIGREIGSRNVLQVNGVTFFYVWAKEKAISKGRELSDHDFHYIPIEMEIDYDEFFHLFHYKRLPSRVKHPRGRVRREIQRLANEIIREIGSFQRKIKPAW